MLLRDPVHGLVTFEGPFEKLVQALLDTREVQRLRRIKQLGLASFVYPGGEHSRFAHAVGTAHVMRRLLNRIHEVESALPKDSQLDQESELDAIAAAMLHDLGHGPFSHLFEEVLPQAKRHEVWTVDILRDDGTEIHRALEAFAKGMSERVISILEHRYRLPYISRAVSGTLDVDRADYLLRDSHMTGARYGLYDLDWLLRALTFAYVDGQYVLAIEGRKGLPAIEAFFLGRYYMYQQVYHHKATRAAEALVRSLFKRVSELVNEGSIPESLPTVFECAAKSEKVALEDYIGLDDTVLHACIHMWTQSKDDELKMLATQFRERRLPKTVPLLDARPHLWQQAYERAKNVASARGFRPEIHVYLDIAVDTPYSELPEESSNCFWVQLHGKQVKKLGELSFLLGELRNKKIERPRLIFPEQIRNEVLAQIGEAIA